VYAVVTVATEIANLYLSPYKALVVTRLEYGLVI
jgi:hypothetical protein